MESEKVLLSVLWIAGSLVSGRIHCVVAGKTFFTNFDGIKGSELLQTFNIAYELTGRGGSVYM